MPEPVAATIYAAQLASQREGYPVWEPDPLGEPAVEIADVGYIENGAWVRLFNVSKPAGDPSNKFGVPPNYRQLEIGEIQKRVPLPRNSPIQSESVLQLAAQTSLTGGLLTQAGGGFNFECSKEQGAVLLLGDDADRQDALRKDTFNQYILDHHASWLTFANRERKCGILLNDLVLVTGCDKTSAWACAAFSAKLSQAGLSVNIGNPGIMQGVVSFSWAWKNCSSVITRSGPQSSTMLSLKNAQPPSGSTDEDGDAIMPEARDDAQALCSSPIRNQCVFLRGFKICDRKTGLTRLLSRKKKRPYDGFIHTSRKDDKEDPDSGPSRPSDPGSLPPGLGGPPPGSSHDSGASQRSPGGEGGGRYYGADTGRQHHDPSGASGSSDPDSLPMFLDEDLDLSTQLDYTKEPTPLDLVLEYILENSAATLALAHDDDLVALLQDQDINFVDNFEVLIRRSAPKIIVNAAQVGTLAPIDRPPSLQASVTEGKHAATSAWSPQTARYKSEDEYEEDRDVRFSEAKEFDRQAEATVNDTESPTTKRGRGRPKGSKNKPRSGAEDSAAPETKRKRGRPPKERPAEATGETGEDGERPPKRPRGRPRKKPESEIEGVGEQAESAGPSAPKKRGRPPKTQA